MSLGRVLVERFEPEVLDYLREHCDIVVVDPWQEPERWAQEAPNVDAVISRKGRVGREHMEASKGRMKLVARSGVGVDISRVDLVAAKEHGIWVTNQPGGNALSVAELVFGQILAMTRHVAAANQAVKDNRWNDYLQFMGTELAGKTIGVIGMGNIGTRVVLRAIAFEMNFLVYDPYIPAAQVTSLGGRMAPLNELLRESDFVTVHCPLNNETRDMIGAEELSLLKPTAYILNLARGGIINEDDLYNALSTKRIAGAALDAMVKEPPSVDDRLIKLDNAYMTPHIGGGTTESLLRLEWGAAEEVVRVLEGKRPLNPVIEIP